MNIPAQRHKHQPGKEHQMSPQPPVFMEHYQADEANVLSIRGDITSKAFCQQAEREGNSCQCGGG